MAADIALLYATIDHLRNRLNFDLMRNVVKCGKYSLAKFAIFSHFRLQTGN